MKHLSRKYAKSSHSHSEHLVTLILRGAIPIVMITAGIIILGMRLSGWSIFSGLPLIIIGSVFLIYTYDEVSRERYIDTSSDEIGIDEDADKNI